MIGERGGVTATREDGEVLQEITKPEWVALVMGRIKDLLETQGEFHSDDLRSMGIPPEHKSVIGNAVGQLVRSGHMVEVGRRKSVAPERHGAKSSVYHKKLECPTSPHEGTKPGQPGASSATGVGNSLPVPVPRTGGTVIGTSSSGMREPDSAGEVEAPAELSLFDVPARPGYLDVEAA